MVPTVGEEQQTTGLLCRPFLMVNDMLKSHPLNARCSLLLWRRQQTAAAKRPRPPAWLGCGCWQWYSERAASSYSCFAEHVKGSVDCRWAASCRCSPQERGAPAAENKKSRFETRHYTSSPPPRRERHHRSGAVSGALIGVLLIVYFHALWTLMCGTVCKVSELTWEVDL